MGYLKTSSVLSVCHCDARVDAFHRECGIQIRRGRSRHEVEQSTFASVFPTPLQLKPPATGSAATDR
jgi:hypothetical protein